MKITKEQFIRGFDAVKAQHAAENALTKLAAEHGNPEFSLGHSPVTVELIRQLQDRCDDPDVNDAFGSDIQYALYEQNMVTTSEGAEPFRMDTAEAVWRWWEETKTGPFTPTEDVA